MIFDVEAETEENVVPQEHLHSTAHNHTAVIPTITAITITVDLLSTTDGFAVAKSSKSRVWDKVQEQSALIYGGTRLSV